VVAGQPLAAGLVRRPHPLAADVPPQPPADLVTGHVRVEDDRQDVVQQGLPVLAAWSPPGAPSPRRSNPDVEHPSDIDAHAQQNRPIQPRPGRRYLAVMLNVGFPLDEPATVEHDDLELMQVGDPALARAVQGTAPLLGLDVPAREKTLWKCCTRPPPPLE
jgi:hypothetical protein